VVPRRYRALLGLSESGRVGGKSWGTHDNDGDASDDGSGSSDGCGGGSDADDAEQQQCGSSRRQGKKASLEMTVTFTPGLEKLGSQLLAKKQEAAARKGDSVWDAYLRWGEMGVDVGG
jgi:hypothetical protein